MRSLGERQLRFLAASPLRVFAFKLLKPPSYAGYDRHYPRCLTEILNIIYSNIYLKIKQVPFECARPNWCWKTYSFLEVKLRKSPKKSWLEEDNIIFVIKKQHTAYSSNQISGPGVTIQNQSKHYFHGISYSLSLENQFLEPQKISCHRNEPKQSISTAWQITEVSNSEKWHAVNIGNHAEHFS